MSDTPYLSGTARPAPFAAQRVVCLLPFVSESLAELALADRLVGVTDDAVFPEGGFPWAERVGLSESPDAERIAALAPDLVLYGPAQARVIEALPADVPVWLVDPRTVRESFNLLWDLMNALEAPQMVARVRAMEWTTDWLERLAETRAAPARVVALIGREPLQGILATDYGHDLLRLCGGDNVLAAAEQGRLLTLDDVVAVQPAVILLGEGGADGFTAHDVDVFAALDTPAARSGRVHLIDKTLLTWPGTRVARALDVLPPLLDADGDAAG
jgi:ABC-type Fe3+-hydroxamate transport system substrate-binding protein